MTTRPIDPDTLAFARKLVRIKAAQLAPARRSADREDIEQTLILEVLLRWPGFDPRRGTREAFVEQIVKGRTSKIIRERRAEPRHAELGQESGRVQDRRDNVRHACLRIDMAELVSTLPPRLRRACDLMCRESQSQAAREMGANRQTLLRTLGKRRARFEQAGLKLYL